MLRVTIGDYPNHKSLIVQGEYGFTLEIHGSARIEIAVAVLNNYPIKLHVDDRGPSVLVDARQDEERLLRVLEFLQRLRSPIRRNEDFRDFLKEPSLERFEGFVGVKKLLEDGRDQQSVDVQEGW